MDCGGVEGEGGERAEGEGEMGAVRVGEGTHTVLFGSWTLSGRACVCAKLFGVYSRVHISFSSQLVSFGWFFV
jgi:hypothetical protein